MKTHIISIMSKDRAGIVAGVTKAIYDLGGDVADVKQTLLYGYFTMILAAQFDDAIDGDTLRQKLASQNKRGDWEISLKTVADDEALQEPLPHNDSYVVTIRGENRRGIVSSISALCAEHAINVIDLETRLHDGLYVLAAQIDISRADCQLAELKAQLQQLSEAKGLSVTIQHNDIFRATNDIRL